MFFLRLCTIVALVAFTTSSPTVSLFGTNVEEMRSACTQDDPIACLKMKAMSFIDWLLQKDNYQLGDNMVVSRNSYVTSPVSSRSEASLEEKVEEYVKSHDLSVELPYMGSTVTLATDRLDNDELNFKVNLNSGVEARKSKLKKILVPILVFVVLKAITLVPLALGVLGLKAWNALQLSFLSFIVAVGLAIFQLCKKIAADHAHPQIAAAHPPWDASYRSFDIGYNSDAQDMAYSAYLQ